MDTVTARLNHGRWLADCPVCNGAELVTAGQPFRCQSRPCTFVGKVEWPAAKLKAQIETLLSGRPVVNQNWEPGETLAQLKRENAAHEIE